ncbi:hypothetical protein OH77DRAFT_389293 [Trametes cingulata]|nr:hypothetical protein OH77DRAFT_389293 [Trametes cingulata]
MSPPSLVKPKLASANQSTVAGPCLQLGEEQMSKNFVIVGALFACAKDAHSRPNVGARTVPRRLRPGRKNGGGCTTLHDSTSSCPSMAPRSSCGSGSAPTEPANTPLRHVDSLQNSREKARTESGHLGDRNCQRTMEDSG